MRVKPLIWTGIAFCVSQSAIFSGLNLAVFGVGRLRLEVEAKLGNKSAITLLRLRKDPNFLLTTILWGNVGINVLLTLLSGSILTGVAAFFFSTVVITFIGEIFPQAYFSRHALQMASLLSPVLRFYQILLFPVAKPVALLLDLWLGKEGIKYYREKDLREMLRQHVEAHETDIDKLEGIGALNFLDIDDILAGLEGENIHPDSVIKLELKDHRPVLPDFERTPSDPFLRKIQASGEKWVIITDKSGDPNFALDADGFLRGALFNDDGFDPFTYIHRPIIVTDPHQPLGKFIVKLRVYAETPYDDVIDDDLILVWSKERQRVITGADILGRLLRGISIVVQEEPPAVKEDQPDRK